LISPEEVIPEDKQTVLISAKNHTGFERLLQCISENLPETAKRGKFLVPYDKAALLNKIREEGKVFSEEYIPEGILTDALVDLKIYHMVSDYKQK
ncbi:MAG: GTPase HflX, partial [Oscillospiraceae bacterium]|nr:GTPase HflX [Oscillospiraceae bacterium]